MGSPSRAQRISTAVAVVLGAGIIGIGARFVLSPANAASDFGVPARPDDPAYLAAKGVRDAVVGAVGLTLLALGDRRAAGWFLIVVALIPVGDAAIVVTHGGSARVALGVHGATAAILAAAGAAHLRQTNGLQRQHYAR